MEKVNPRLGRVFLRASALIIQVPHRFVPVGLKPHLSLCLDWPADYHSDIRTALSEGNRLRLSQIHFEGRSRLPRGISRALRNIINDIYKLKKSCQHHMTVYIGQRVCLSRDDARSRKKSCWLAVLNFRFRNSAPLFLSEMSY